MKLADFKPGLLYTDRNLRQPLKLATSGYVPPKHIDLRWQLLPSSNQGSQPKCAGYMMAGKIEEHRYRMFGEMRQVDPNPIYDEAKTNDGYPNQDGTTLEAVLQAAERLKLISSLDDIRGITTLAEVKQAVHRFGAVLAAFTITENWGFAKPDGWIPSGGSKIGGHAVLICGYSDLEDWVAVQNSWGTEHGWQGIVRLHQRDFEDQFDYGLVWTSNGEPAIPIPPPDFTHDPLKPR